VRSVRVSISAKPVQDLTVLAEDKPNTLLSAEVRIRNSTL
jgi:hypothetical protein